MRRWRNATGAFDRALQINPDDARAHAGMAQALLHMGRNEEAAEHALQAVGLRHMFPAAHVCLGVALFQLRMLGRATEAFEQSVAMGGSQVALARRWLRRVRKLQSQLAEAPVK